MIHMQIILLWKCISHVKIYLLERCPLDSSVVLDCTLGALELDFLLSGGLYPLCFACPKCDLSAENQNRNLSGKWDANTMLKVKHFSFSKKKSSQFFIIDPTLYPSISIIKLLFYQIIWQKKLPLRTNSLNKKLRFFSLPVVIIP